MDNSKKNTRVLYIKESVKKENKIYYEIYIKTMYYFVSNIVLSIKKNCDNKFVYFRNINNENEIKYSIKKNMNCFHIKDYGFLLHKNDIQIIVDKIINNVEKKNHNVYIEEYIEINKNKLHGNANLKNKYINLTKQENEKDLTSNKIFDIINYIKNNLPSGDNIDNINDEIKLIIRNILDTFITEPNKKIQNTFDSLKHDSSFGNTSVNKEIESESEEEKKEPTLIDILDIIEEIKSENKKEIIRCCITDTLEDIEDKFCKIKNKFIEFKKNKY